MPPVKKNRLRNERLMKPSEQFEGTVGSLVWGKVRSSPWWPGIIITEKDCGLPSVPSGYVWVFWLKDCRVSKVNNNWIKEFKKSFNLYFSPEKKPKMYMPGVLQGVKMCAESLGHNAESWTNEFLLDWAKSGFHQAIEGTSKDVPLSLSVLQAVTADIERIRKLNTSNEMSLDNVKPSTSKYGGTEIMKNCTVKIEKVHLVNKIHLFNIESIKNGKGNIENLCLGCKSLGLRIVAAHPFFEGGLCELCLKMLQSTIFLSPGNNTVSYCTICSQQMRVIVCKNSDCLKSYCHSCIDLMAAEGGRDWIREQNSWLCFLCDKPRPSVYGLIKARPSWSNNEKIISLFKMDNCVPPRPLPKVKKMIRVLSLFDGVSTGLVVLKNLGFKVEKYYASEVDPDAINVSKYNHQSAVTPIGDIRTLGPNELSALGRIDLVIGGSPCSELSLVNPAHKGLISDSTGMLFFEFFRLLGESALADAFWLFENTAAMPLEYKNIISKFLKCQPVVINAAMVTAQKRIRFFWGNIPCLGRELLPKFNVNLQDSLIPGLNRQATVNKIRTVTTQSNSLRQGKDKIDPVIMNGVHDKLWLTEMETLFGLPKHYTDTGNLQLGKRQKLLGKAWSAPVIEHILEPLKMYFVCEKKPSL